MSKTRWRWRGSVAMLGVAMAFVMIDITGFNDVVNSDWPAFATGGRLMMSDPTHLYDFEVQRRVELDVTGGRSLVTLGIHGILPFLAPAWVAFLAIPFELLGTNVGGRLWVLFGLACLGLGLYLAVRPRPPSAILPAFASVPTFLLLLNAQLDGLVVLGIGAATSLWSRPYFAGLALGLTFMKPQLVLPLGAALLFARRWKVIAGWAASGVLLWAAAALLNPRWVMDWLAHVGTTVQPGSREVDLPHFGTLFPAGFQTIAEATLALAGIVAVVLLARRQRDDFRCAATVLVAGGVLMAPHALPTDLVLVAAALAMWGQAEWFDWLILSIGTAVAALTPAPVPAVVGLLVIAWVCLRAGGFIARSRRGQATTSAG